MGAARTFVNHALVAIERAGGDPTKVEWPKVEGAAAREAISQNGQSPQSVTRAICELSPARVNKAGHAKVAEWVASVAPKYLQQHETQRGKGKSLER